MKRIPKNTKRRGTFRALFIKEGKKITGVCLDFNIVEEGKKLEEVRENLLKSSILHLKTIQKNNLSDSLLNRHAPKEYWDMYNKVVGSKTTGRGKKTPVSTLISPYYPNRLPVIK